MTIRDTAPNRLIVEGLDDMHSIISLTKRHGWNWDKPQAHVPYIQNAKGVEPALAAIAVTVRSYNRVGIVLDADLSLASRWDAVRNQLKEFDFDFPTTPTSEGTILQSAQKHVGIWLMPNNQSVGKLEDFLAALIPPDDKTWPWAKESTAAARAEHAADFTENDEIKAQIHTWLAWQANPGNPFGTALTANVFAHDATVAAAFVAWMTRLFKE